MTGDREELRRRILHDLHNPLTAIIGYGELLAVRADEETRLEASRSIVAAARQLSATIDAVLDELLPRDA